MKKKNHTTKAKSHRFSLLVVPNGSSHIKRLELSRKTLTAAVCGVFFVFVLFVGSIAGLAHYRGSYNDSKFALAEAARYAEESAALKKRVAELEGGLGRVERFASKIEAAVKGSDASSKDNPAGIGPVDEESWIPESKEIDSVTAPSMHAGVWRSPFADSLGKGLNLSLNNLSDRIEDVEERVHSAFALQTGKLRMWASLPSIQPANGWVTSEFGDVRGSKRKGSRVHEGIDIAAPRGTPIMAAGGGVVTFAGYYHGYGNMLIVDHGHGITTLYGHCQSIFVAEGQNVKRGMLVAAVGNTGRSTGPHLHYEVQVDGVPVNPMLYIMRDL